MRETTGTTTTTTATTTSTTTTTTTATSTTTSTATSTTTSTATTTPTPTNHVPSPVLETRARARSFAARLARKLGWTTKHRGRAVIGRGRGRGLGLGSLLLLVMACAHRPTTPVDRSPSPDLPPSIAFPPEEVKASRIDVELEGKNDEELFAVGTAAYGAADYARAATAFARLADLFPSSRHEAAALFDAGLAYERLDEWRLALERFRTLERKYEGPDAVEAGFRVAECLYHLGEMAEARAKLDALAHRGELPAGERVRALAQRGIVELEEGKLEDAETSLRLAVHEFQTASEEERLDDHYASQAQYYLGEVYREWFRALALDPSKGDDAALERDLEHKAEMLLSAQGHYLRAIRMGSDRWAVASGYRIGELYDELRTQLLEAPLPPGLDAEHAGAYRGELRRRVRVLATKAITAYEQTLARASRSGVDDLKFLADAQGSLERLKEALVEDARPAGM